MIVKVTTGKEKQRKIHTVTERKHKKKVVKEENKLWQKF